MRIINPPFNFPARSNVFRFEVETKYPLILIGRIRSCRKKIAEFWQVAGAVEGKKLQIERIHYRRACLGKAYCGKIEIEAL